MLVSIQNKTISTELIYSVTGVRKTDFQTDYYNGYTFRVNFIGGTFEDIIWDLRFSEEELEPLKQQLQNELRVAYTERAAEINKIITGKENEFYKLGKEALIKAHTELINLWQGSTSPIKVIETP